MCALSTEWPAVEWVGRSYVGEAHVGGARSFGRDRSLSAALAREVLLFDAFVAGKARVDIHPFMLSPELHRRAVATAEGVIAAIDVVGDRGFEDASERALYGFPEVVRRLASASRRAGDDAWMARVDLLLGEDGRWHACEINSDCAGGHNEAVGLPRMLRRAGFLAGRDPTTLVPAIVDRLIGLARGEAVAFTYATAFAEDMQVCALLRRELRVRGVDAILCPPTAPKMDGATLTVSGRKIGAIYRYFPTEYMEGQDNVDDLERAVASGAVRTLTSFGKMFTQSKLAFARAWAHVDDLTRDHAATVRAEIPMSIDASMIPVATLIGERAEWVLKRALGRVGDQVYVGALIADRAWEETLLAVFAGIARGERWIAQRFVRQRPVATPFGDRYVTLGAYVLDGKFLGYFARFTPESHVSHDALCLPVLVADDDAPARSLGAVREGVHSTPSMFATGER